MTSATSLCELFQQTAAARSSEVALRGPAGTQPLTWAEYRDRVRRTAAAFSRLGVGPGDSVALMLRNQPWFNVCDTAALHIGATPFSIYNTSTPDQIAYVISNASSRVVVCDQEFVPRINAARRNAPIDHVVCVDGSADGAVVLDILEDPGDSAGFDFEAAWRAVQPSDVLTLIYTSGTTGPPKGVELTHGNMLAELNGTQAVLPARPGDRVISYLPSAHVADRWISHYQAIAHGIEVTCVPDARQLPAALREVRPTYWGAVPRVWEKLQAALTARIGAENDPQRAAAFRAAMDIGYRKVNTEQGALRGDGRGPSKTLLQEWERADESLHDLRGQVGLEEARVVISGAAPTPVPVLEFFAALGIPICELWGMSELSCCATVNPPGRIKIGTVGTPLPGVEVQLATDGELLCRGDIVMKQYRNDPARTEEILDRDGWLHTGDLAEIDADGYVRIVDRKKELIINAAGKNMSPANIESQIKSASPLIGQAVCIGDGRPYNVALLVLDPDGYAAFAADEGLSATSPAALVEQPALREAVAAAVAHANQQLSRVEQIKRFQILPVDWEAGGDELTPTMKLKRKPIAEKYQEEIEALYNADTAELKGRP